MKLSKNIIGLILGPFFFSLILLFFDAEGLSIEAKCILASTVWMAVWWVTECVPISCGPSAHTPPWQQEWQDFPLVMEKINS